MESLAQVRAENVMYLAWRRWQNLIERFEFAVGSQPLAQLRRALITDGVAIRHDIVVRVQLTIASPSRTERFWQ